LKFIPKNTTRSHLLKSGGREFSLYFPIVSPTGKGATYIMSLSCGKKLPNLCLLYFFYSFHLKCLSPKQFKDFMLYWWLFSQWHLPSKLLTKMVGIKACFERIQYSNTDGPRNNRQSEQILCRNYTQCGTFSPT
jgi:hypothetical protein